MLAEYRKRQPESKALCAKLVGLAMGMSYDKTQKRERLPSIGRWYATKVKALEEVVVDVNVSWRCRRRCTSSLTRIMCI